MSEWFWKAPQTSEVIEEYREEVGEVIEIQKVLDVRAQTPLFAGHLTSGYPGRSDLPRPIHAYGSLGSGAAAATTSFVSSSIPLKLRLVTSGPILTIKSDLGGLQVFKKVFALGGSMTLTNHDTAGNAFRNLVSLGYGANPWPLFGGKVFLNLPAIPFNSGTIGADGSTSRTLQIPNLTNLIGAHLVFQGASVAPRQLPRLTNSVDCIISR